LRGEKRLSYSEFSFPTLVSHWRLSNFSQLWSSNTMDPWSVGSGHLSVTGAAELRGAAHSRQPMAPQKHLLMHSRVILHRETATHLAVPVLGLCLYVLFLIKLELLKLYYMFLLFYIR
jgi:hypothetical protein